MYTVTATMRTLIVRKCWSPPPPFGDWSEYNIESSISSDEDIAAAIVIQRHERMRCLRKRRREVLRRAWMAREEQKNKHVRPVIPKDMQKRMCTLMVMHTKRFMCIMNPYKHTVQHLYEDVAKIAELDNFKLLLQGKSVHNRRHKKLYHVGATAGNIYIVRVISL